MVATSYRFDSGHQHLKKCFGLFYRGVRGIFILYFFWHRTDHYKKIFKTCAAIISNIIKENKLLNRKEKLERKINFLEKLADSLREDEKTIIKGFYIKGKTNRKIALELDITIEAVKKRKKRILIRLQNEYKR